MSTPNDPGDNEWQQPGDPTRPVPQSPPSGYGTPSSPSYGRYGQGTAEPVPPQAPQQPAWGQPQPAWGQPADGQPGWGQNGQHGQPPASPPGQQAWGQPSWMTGAGAFRPSGGLGVAVTVMAALLAVAYWLSAVLSPAADSAYEAAVADGKDVTTMITGYDVVGLLTFPVMIAAWIVTSIWLGRARDNALLLNPGGQRRSTIWVWIGWLVPVVSLWFPKQILDDTIRDTTPAAGLRPISTAGYWASWIAVLLLGNAQFQASFRAEPQDAVNPGLEFASAVVMTVALVLWVRIVRRISAAQDQLAATGPVGPGAGTGPTLPR